tara:strand:- start:68 stop:262 length:195 start_codon:yes stop_codon:yes gene_type:complete
VTLKAEPAVVTAKSVSIKAGTPAVTEPMFNPPTAPEVVVPEIVVEGVILEPVAEYVDPILVAEL